MTRAVIIRLAGGLGNQLFQYAFGRALAIRNEVPLILDALSGFPRDPFRRSYSLSPYDIRCDYLLERQAFASPMGRLQRRLLQAWSRQLPLARRPYVEEPDATRWDPAISALRVTRRVCFEGYWQHEEYFREIRDQLQGDLTPSRPLSAAAQSIADRIPERSAIAIHVRCLRHAAAGSSLNPRLEIDPGYYERAIAFLAARIPDPVFFVFSDEPEWARQHVACPYPAEYLDGGRSDYEDLWLMSRCHGFIIGNSTFSWWAAWLSHSEAACVVAPSSGIGRGLRSVPGSWFLL